MVKVTVFDTNAFISRVRSVVLSLEVVVEKYLADIMQKEAKSNINDDFKDTLAQFKASITARDISGNTKTFPAEVYNILLARHAIKYAPQIENIDGTLIKEMQNYIADILGTDETVVTTDGVYKVSTQFAKSGLSTVTDSNERLYTLTWRNDSAKESLYSLLRSLKSWGQNFQNYFFEQLFKSSPEQIFVKWTTALITCKPSDVRALYKAIKKFAKAQKANDDDSAWTDDDYSNWLSKLTNELFPTTINKEIAALQKKYQTLDDLARDTALLKDYKANANMTVDTIKNTITNLNSYKKFIKAYNDLQTAIGQSTSNFDSLIPNYIGYEITNVVSGTFNEDNATITCANGDNEITVKGNNVKVDTGHGNDYIYNYGSNSTIDANTGDDSIRSQASNVSIQGGDGNDNIETWNSSVTIQGSAGDDSIYSHGSDSSIFGGVGNDEILISGGYADGGTGVDTIAIQGSNVTAYGGGSFDYLPTKDVFNIASGASNIYINDFEFGDVLNLPAGSYTARIEFGSTAIRNSNGKLIVWLNGFTERLENLTYNENGKKTTDGNDSINNDASNIKIDLGAGNDYAYNSGNNVTIDGGKGNNLIENGYYKGYYDKQAGGSNVSINTGDGNNTVYSYLSIITVKTSAGDDLISIHGGYDSLITTDVDAGDGNNAITIYNGDSSTINATIKTGSGDDYIYIDSNSNSSIDVDAGDGNNTINAHYYSYHDATVKTGSDDDFISIHTGSVDAGDGNNTVRTWDDSTVKTGSGNDSISGGNSIDAGEGNNTVRASESATVKTGAGDDSVSGGSSIDAGEGNNTVRASESATVKTSAGDDLISIYGGYNTSIDVNAGKGNDTILSSVYTSSSTINATIKTGSGDNYIYIYGGSNSSIDVDAGDGNNTVKIDGYSYSSSTINATIKTGSGDDYISIYGGSNSSIDVDVSDGNNTVLVDEYRNENANITVKTGSGNDYVSISSGLIDAGEGNNTVYARHSAIVKTGSGDDYVSLHGDSYSSIKSNANVNVGEGNNTILVDYYSNGTTVKTGSGDDYVSIRSNGSIDAGDGNNTIHASGNSTVKTGVGDDFISIYGGSDSSIDVNAGDGNNTVAVSSYYSTVNAIIKTGSGDDFISIYGSGSIDAGDGDNTVRASGNSTVKSGSGNDYISISGGSSIDAGVGNDTIYAWSNSIVKTSSGDDFVSISSGSIDAGDGNNTIHARYGATTVRTGSGSDYVSICGGSNSSIDVNVGDGNNIVLVAGVGYSDLPITAKTGSGDDFISISGSNSGSDSVIISTGAGKDSIIIGDTRYTSGSKVTISGGTGDDLISLRSTSHNNLIEYTAGAGNDTIWGFTNSFSSNTLSIIGDKYTRSTVGNDVIITVGDGSITLKDAKGKTLNIDGTEENYWSLSDTTAKYGTSSKTLVTVKGVKSLDGISLKNKVVTVSKVSVNAKDITISEGYTLKLSGVNPPTPTPAHFSGLTYKSASSSEGYSLSGDKKTISYSPAVDETDLFTLTNVKNTDSITVNQSNKTVTLKANNLTGKNVSITGDYSLKLANDVPTSTTKTAGSFTKFKSGTATFKTSSYSDFYSLKNNQVTYTAPSGGKAISIKNLKSSATLDEIKSAISVAEQKNGTYKISFKSADVLTSKAPTISASGINYTVALDKSLKPASLAPDWKISGTNASLKSDTSASYTVSDNKVLYSKKVTGSPQLVLSGLVKNSSLSAPVKKVVTLDTKVLGSNTSLKSNDSSYTVKLTGNMSKKTFTGSVNADSLNIAANNAAVLGGAGNDSFTVTGSKVTLTGGKGNDSFKLSGKNPVLIYGTGDGNDSVNFVAGMHISLSGSTQIKTFGKSGSDLVLGFGKNSSLKVTGAKSTDTLKVSDASGSVTLVAGKFDLANSLTFNSKNSSVTVAKNFSGSLAPSDNIYLGGSKLSGVATINAGNVTSSITITANDKANFISAGKNNDEIFSGNGNDSIVGNAGNDKLYGQNGNDSLNGGAGNDSLWGGDGKDVFIYSAGKDVIADFTVGQDKIQIASGKISKTSLSGSDVRFTIGKGFLTLKNAKGKTISLLDSAGKTSSTVVGAQTLTNSNKASITIGTDMGFVDASARTKAISIKGNALANTISGGSKNDSIFGAAGNDSILGNDGNDKLYGDAGNDILLGGKGNDSLWGEVGNDTLTGNDGNDFFIYESGKDVISDYTAGQDKILIAGGKISKTSLSGSDVLFTIGKGSLTVKKAKGKTISLIDSSNKASSTVVGAQALTNSNKASVTIAADMGAVDSSARTKAIAITGNTLANTISGGTKNDSLYGATGNDSILGNDGNDKLYGDAGNDIIYGGKGNDSLWGGAGNDSLWGDDGADKFIYGKGDGKDIIYGFDSKDTLTLDNITFKTSMTTYDKSKGTLTLNISGGSITLKDSATTTFNINNDTYKVSGTSLKKQ